MSALIERVSRCLDAVGDMDAADSRRLFHGRGQCYPGFDQVTVDLFAPLVLLTFFKESDDGYESGIIESLVPVLQARGVMALVVQRRYRQGVPSECVFGVMPDEWLARRGESRFGLQLDGRQNVGFFLDMEPGRQWLSIRAQGKKVLNLFAYTCAFSVVAQKAGAVSVVNVDMSRGALSRGRENHRLNHLPTDSIKFLSENILKSWSRIARPGPFDIAIIDPPSYQPGSFVAEKDYRKLLRRIPQFMATGGDLLLCLNSPQLGVEFLLQLMDEECPACQWVERLTPSEDFPDSDPGQQLKLCHFRYIP